MRRIHIMLTLLATGLSRPRIRQRHFALPEHLCRDVGLAKPEKARHWRDYMV
jgi:hypothetical protein